MAYSYVNYTGDGSNRNFAVPFSFRSRADVSVTINEVPTEAWTWTNDALINITTAPATGAIVKLSRATDKASLATVYSTPTVFDHRDFNAVLTQLLYVCQEAYDLGVVPLNELGVAIENLQAMVAAAAGSAAAASTARDAAVTARDEAEAFASSASEIADFNPDLYLRVANVLSELTGVAAAARTAIGAAAASDIPTSTVRYSSQTLSGPQAEQARENIGAYGGGVIDETLLEITGTIQIDGGKVALKDDGTRYIEWRDADGYYNFQGAPVYASNGRLLGTSDAAQIVSDLRTVGAGGGFYSNNNTAAVTNALVSSIEARFGDGGITVGFKYVQMKIGATWYTVAAIS